MKNLLKGLMVALVLFASGTAFGQTTFNVDNATSCSYKLTIALSPSSGSCLPAGSVLNVFVQPGSNTFTIPGTNGVRRVKFFGCCGTSSGSSVVSFYCGNNIAFGTTECNGLPVTFNFVQNNLIEVSN